MELFTQVACNMTKIIIIITTVKINTRGGNESSKDL